MATLLPDSFSLNNNITLKTPEQPPVNKDRFKNEVQKIFQREGGYVNDPRDRGGETIFGISRRSHPEVWARGVPTRDQAEEIYRRHYWDAIKADYLPPKTASVLMDHAVLSGTGAAVNSLRRSLGLGEGRLDPEIIERANTENDDQTAAKITQDRISLFRTIAAKDPTQQKYLNHWIKRAHSTLKSAGIDTDLLNQDLVISPKRLTRGLNPDTLMKERLANKKSPGVINFGIKQAVLTAGRRLIEESRHADDIEKNKNPG